jgi:glycosyltransferase involved in cell wall biosynthesis
MRFLQEDTMKAYVNTSHLNMVWVGRENKEGNIEDNKQVYDVSVIVCTYNQAIDKMFYTLKSIIIQKGISVQLIVSDDGSVENNFGQIEHFLFDNGFEDFVLVGSKSNHGTVINLMQGIEKASGHFIKPLSPGDAFVEKHALCKWVDDMKKQGRRWSFANVACYYTDENGVNEIKHNAYPLDVSPYLRKDDERCRWNYLVLDDIALGAAVLGEKDVMLEYLHRIKGKVKYAEDNIWRLMMFDGIVPSYYSETMLYYEIGCGISTSGNKSWAMRLKQDWDAATREMLRDLDGLDSFQRKIWHGTEVLKQKSKFGKLFVLGKFKMFLIKRVIPRKTRLIKNRE